MTLPPPAPDDETETGGQVPAFEVLDALDGFCRLERRDGTLGGSVPLRVAQGCVPLLEGNAFGWQVVLTRELVVERRLTGWSVAAREQPDALAAACRAAVPRLRAQGFLGAAWARALGAGPGWGEGGLRASRLRLWTGLLIRPLAGHWVRVSATANRRNVRFEVATHLLDEGEGFTPLVLDLTLARGELRLAGELATIAPVAPRAGWRTRSLDEAPEVGQAHGDFYDAAYFATKKGEITRKYRRLIRRQPGDGGAAAACELIEAGPAAHRIAPVGPFLGPGGPAARERSAGGELGEVHLANLIAFRATFDGHRLAIEPDAAALAAGGRQVEARFASALGPSFQPAHRGALWYLTKYFTPHPAGEAHFFVKPWAFVRTPPGWSSLVEGEHGPGYDVMRGVVSTDRFHATPAVFWLHGPTSIEVPAGAPLARLVPVPRALLAAGWRAVGWRDQAPGAKGA